MVEGQCSPFHSAVNEVVNGYTTCASLSLLPSEDILSRATPSIAVLVSDSVLSVLIRGSSCGRCFASNAASSTVGTTVAPSDSDANLVRFQGSRSVNNTFSRHWQLNAFGNRRMFVGRLDSRTCLEDS